MVKKIRSDQSGAALILTLIIISVLISVTVLFYKDMFHNYMSSVTYADQVQLDVISSSGIGIGQALLIFDRTKNDFDSFNDNWGEAGSRDYSGLFERGNLELRIVDHSGKLQLNALVGAGTGKKLSESKRIATLLKEVFFRLLNSGQFTVENEQQAREVVDSIVDWIDKDSFSSDFGVESSYYQALEKPYQAGNGKLSSLEELRLVKGITKELLYGTEEKKGLISYVTVFGDDGKINLNTAPVELVLALDADITGDMVKEFDEYRRKEEQNALLADTDWYLELPGWSGDVVLPESIITSKSSYFEIKATGSLHAVKRTKTAVVHRDTQNDLELLTVKVE